MTKSELITKTDAFFAEFDGKAADYDHAYGNQCKDVFSYFNHDVIGNNTYIYGDAVKLWDNCPSNLYEQILNTPSGVPQKCDIVIWHNIGAYKDSNGKTIYAGHVAIATGEGDTNNFKSFDENWPVGSLCHFQSHNYNNVIGWLRPKLEEVQNVQAPVSVPDPIVVAPDPIPVVAPNNTDNGGVNDSAPVQPIASVPDPVSIPVEPTVQVATVIPTEVPIVPVENEPEPIVVPNIDIPVTNDKSIPKLFIMVKIIKLLIKYLLKFIGVK